MSETDDQTEKAGDTEGDEVSDVTKLQTELDKAKKDYLYLLAEFDNYRKNAIKERSDLTKYGSERFVREFLNVFDNVERALESELTTENIETFQAGVKMIATELRGVLQRNGVEEVKAEGLVFDPNKHEALSSEPREDIPPGHVSKVFKKAYKLHDKLIRPAQVVVSVAKPAVN